MCDTLAKTAFKIAKCARIPFGIIAKPIALWLRLAYIFRFNLQPRASIVNNAAGPRQCVRHDSHPMFLLCGAVNNNNKKPFQGKFDDAAENAQALLRLLANSCCSSWWCIGIGLLSTSHVQILMTIHWWILHIANDSYTIHYWMGQDANLLVFGSTNDPLFIQWKDWNRWYARTNAFMRGFFPILFSKVLVTVCAFPVEWAGRRRGRESVICHGELSILDCCTTTWRNVLFRTICSCSEAEQIHLMQLTLPCIIDVCFSSFGRGRKRLPNSQRCVFLFHTRLFYI